jgi:hypothetical protein
MTSAACAQSLGDVARENREKKAEDGSAVPAKVITNKDLPKDADAGSQPASTQTAANPTLNMQAADPGATQLAAEQRLAETVAAAQWKRQILSQKNRVATLQARIDQCNALMRATYGTVQYEGPSGRSQARQLQQVAEIQQQLDQQKRKLDRMQEAARRAGMHSAVYDP